MEGGSAIFSAIQTQHKKKLLILVIEPIDTLGSCQLLWFTDKITEGETMNSSPLHPHHHDGSISNEFGIDG